MGAAEQLSVLTLRRQEIEALVAGNDSRSAGARLLDFVKDFCENRALLREALVVHQNITALREDERRHGSSPETTRQGNILITRLLEFVDQIADANGRTAPESSRIRLVKNEGPADVGADSPGKALPFEKAFAEFQKSKSTPPDPEVVFSCRGICRGYRGNTAFKLRGVDLDLTLGTITGLVGANAAGKSTLLRMIAGELLPDDGTATYPLLAHEARHPRDFDWASVRSQIAFVRQHPHRCHGRIQDILCREAALRGVFADENLLEVEFLLQRMGIDRFKSARWGELSGGYRMRFELVKALVSRPRLLILDEPLAPLDVDSQLLFLQDLKCIATSSKRPISVIISSQHLYETEAIADQLLFLKDGEVDFYGPTADLGSDRSLNTFELGTSAARADVDRVLGGLIQAFEETTIGMYFIYAPRSTSSGDVLKALVEKRIAINYFRDVSRSARSLFDSARMKS